MNPGAQFVDPRVLARLASLELVARTVVEGFLSGLHRSPNLGLSTDFAEHRPYLPGDDLRRLDWKLWGRTDRLYLKEFEAETNAAVTVLLDRSRSMDFGTAGYTKLDYARRMAACLLWFSQSQRDRVGLVAFDDGITDYVPPSTRHLPHALYALERIGADAGTAGPHAVRARSSSGSPMRRSMRAAGEHLKRRGITIVISDLYESPDDVTAALGHLRRRGGDVTVFHVLDPAELAFPFGEASSFEDLETGERIPVIPDRLREEYRERVAAHRTELRRRLGADGIDYAFFDTSMPLDHALYAYLAGRQRRRAGRGTGSGLGHARR